ncbi:MAG: hypothetical protein IJN64_13330 [Lachnospiraceae bacterium]|nr:hypothetical protein [Lachnospiraceae bacterium]
MNIHGLIVGMLIASLVMVLALFVWRAFIGVKHKNNAELNTVISKARAFSALSLWIIYFFWETITFFIDANTTFTISSVRTIVVILLGVQCAMELIAGIYYEKKI